MIRMHLKAKLDFHTASSLEFFVWATVNHTITTTMLCLPYEIHLIRKCCLIKIEDKQWKKVLEIPQDKSEKWNGFEENGRGTSLQ